MNELNRFSLQRRHLLAASAAISGVQNASALQYQDKQLRISGLSLTPEALTDAQQSLQATGYLLSPEGADLLLSSKPKSSQP